MARTALTIYDTAVIGLDVSADEAAGTSDGKSFANGAGDIVLYARNSGAGAHVVTIQTPQTVEGLAVAENDVTISAGKIKILGPFPPATFNQSDGTVYVDQDGTDAEMVYVACRVARRS